MSNTDDIVFKDGTLFKKMKERISDEEELNNSDFMCPNIATNMDSYLTVINVDELNSDLEDGLEDSLKVLKEEDGTEDVEIDLLSDRVSLKLNDDDNSMRNYFKNSMSHSYLNHCKVKYRSVVHKLRNLDKELHQEKNKHELKSEELVRQITALSTELDNLKQQQSTSNQHDSLLSVSTTVSDNDKSCSDNPQPVSKASTKIKDLERILAKCKESLKQKNSQISNLKEALSEVEKFKDYNQELRSELNELKEAHETWTVSIAENKRVMHQEIEDKLSEIAKLQQENNDSNNKIKQLKSSIQDLESRLVSTSVAHQKERESLKKELIADKNNAMKQLKKEHEHNVERVKLDLEKSLLSKDEQLVAHTEKFQQELHELNARLDLITTANEDQEKEIKSLREEREAVNESYKSLKFEYEELTKKNESLNCLIKDNETEMQTNQEQLDELVNTKRELEILKKENASLMEKSNQLKNELGDKNTDLLQSNHQLEQMTQQNEQLKVELENTHKTSENLTKEKDTLIVEAETSKKQKRELQECLVVGILTAIKNLETPTTSPGSDKVLRSVTNAKPEVNDKSDSNQVKDLPDPVNLMDELSSIAIDRCNSYMTATQRLQAVQLENSVMSDEINRLKEELNNLNQEKNDDMQRSVEEVERLRTENQALIHDLHSYEDKIHELGEEQNAKDDKIKQILEEKNAICKPKEEEIQFEYLKNIIYQFMLGKEPVVLARVISAFFKFDKNQVDQICKIQEALNQNI